MALSAIQVHLLKQAPGVEGVLPAMLNRWSSRSFTEREVAPADLANLRPTGGHALRYVRYACRLVRIRFSVCE